MLLNEILFTVITLLRREGDLQEIINQYQTDSFPCSTCGKMYRRSRSLWRHQKFECGKDPQFLCSSCPAKFYQKSNLKLHFVTKHTNHIQTMFVG